MVLDDRFYKSTEVADILGVSLRTLYRYMDAGKIESVQLPSGRHRFTKKQIEDFLFTNNFGGTLPSTPNENINVGGSQPQQTQQVQQPQQSAQSPSVNMQQNAQQQSYGSSAPSQSDDADLEAELDELLKSLDDDDSDSSSQQDQQSQNAGQQSDPFAELTASLDNSSPSSSQQPAEQNTQPPTPVQSAPQPAPAPAVSTEEQQADDLLSELDSFSSSSSSILDQDQQQQPAQPVQAAPQPQPAANVLDENKIHYFYCPYNDLKTVAKMVKKVGDDNNKNYAFTLNAGLSLFFPLDPFSVIHFYVSEGDLDFYKENLQLKESNQTDANVGLLLTRGEAFEDSREVSGLKVVGKQKLIQNLRANGMDALANESENKLD